MKKLRAHSKESVNVELTKHTKLHNNALLYQRLSLDLTTFLTSHHILAQSHPKNPHQHKPNVLNKEGTPLMLKDYVKCMHELGFVQVKNVLPQEE